MSHLPPTLQRTVDLIVETMMEGNRPRDPRRAIPNPPAQLAILAELVETAELFRPNQPAAPEDPVQAGPPSPTASDTMLAEMPLGPSTPPASPRSEDTVELQQEKAPASPALPGPWPDQVGQPAQVAPLAANVPVPQLRGRATRNRRRRQRRPSMIVTCPICLDQIVRRRQMARSNCNHTFHARCLDQWFNTGRGSCPVCRRPDIVYSTWAGPCANTPDFMEAARRMGIRIYSAQTERFRRECEFFLQTMRQITTQDIINGVMLMGRRMEVVYGYQHRPCANNNEYDYY